MPVWHITIRLGDLINDRKSGKDSIAELATKVVERIKASSWRTLTPYPETFDGLLHDLSVCIDEEDYRAAFEEIYDLADSDRVWIETSR